MFNSNSFFKKSIKSALLVAMLFSGLGAMAHSFYEDGIYYGILSDSTVYVTYKGNSQNEYAYEYSGSVVVPPEVTHDGKTYTVTRIGDRAFWYNAVTDVTLPNTITKIGCCVFENCTHLLDVNIPNSVTSIDWGVFMGCINITSIYIPESVSYIGSYPFRGCTSLEYIYVDEENPYYDSREDCNAIIETATNTIVATCPNSFLPTSVTAIGDYAFTSLRSLTEITLHEGITDIGTSAFSGTGLTSIDIPSTVTHIGGGAFSGTKLTSLYIPSTVTTISYNPISGCSDLTSVIVDEQNPNYDSRNNCNAIIRKSDLTLLGGCKTTIIPETVKIIGNAAFNSIDGLTSITIPNRVTSIEPNCFSNCLDLERVIIGTGLKNIGGSAFHTCPSLVEVNLDNNLNLQTIGTWAFVACQSLTSFTFPSTVKTIGGNCFNLCYNLRTVTCKSSTPPTASGNYCFSDSTRMYGTLYVPVFGLEAYRTADVWKDFFNIEILPTVFCVDDIYYVVTSENTASVTTNPADLSDYVNNYSGDIVIPESVTYRGLDFAITAIGKNAFDGSSITSIEIPNSVTAIEAEAFQGCTSLTNVVIGKNVASIGQRAFNYCNAIETVSCKGLEPAVMEHVNSFSSNAYGNALLLIPWCSYDDYVNTNYWSRFVHWEHYIAPGDVDGDGRISVKDISILIDMLLGASNSAWYPQGADMDGDGRMSVKDVSLLIQQLINS